MGELRSGSVSLAEIIAYVKQTNQTGRLTIRSEQNGDPPTMLAFEAGHLIDAQRDEESGDDLVYQLLGHRGAVYTFEHTADLPPAGARSIARWQELLILAAIGALSEEDAAPAAPAFPEAPAGNNAPHVAPPPPAAAVAASEMAILVQPTPPAPPPI